MQGRDALVHDARFVLGGQVGKGYERAHQEAETEVVVAQGKGRAQTLRQLVHEAEGAGVLALNDVVENQSVEVEAPIFPFVADKLHHAGIAVGIHVRNLHDVVGGKPAPVDDVAHGVPIDGRDEATRREPGVVRRGIRLYVRDGRTAKGSAGLPRRIRGRIRRGLFAARGAHRRSKQRSTAAI